jgi:hypothetical protein
LENDIGRAHFLILVPDSKKTPEEDILEDEQSTVPEGFEARDPRKSAGSGDDSTI